MGTQARNFRNRPWKKLFANFRAHLERGSHWLEILEIIASDDDYLAELQDRALRFTRNSHDCEEIQQQALFYLAQELRHAPGLHFDWERAEQFPAWICTVIFNHCLMAYRDISRRQGKEIHLVELPEVPVEDRSEQLLDYSMALERLEEPVRSVMLQLEFGYTIMEASRRLNMKYKLAYRLAQEGVKALQEKFAD